MRPRQPRQPGKSVMPQVMELMTELNVASVLAGDFAKRVAELEAEAKDWIVNGWDLSGRPQEWEERANANGWCWRDTHRMLTKVYDKQDLLRDISMRASPFLTKVQS